MLGCGEKQCRNVRATSISTVNARKGSQNPIKVYYNLSGVSTDIENM